MDAIQSLVKYVLALEQSAEATACAEDRSIYKSLLADAGPILATASALDAQSNIAPRIFQHERLWGYSWLQDPVFQSASDAWQAVKLAYVQAAV
ncbi:hypothetical protein [Oleiagrimonas sp. C23AA]|uniref:hypothetical protein n=1 Tax=Oleiagrimonas sp. C23AA TaxID=2719047 RepID=UPI00142125C1|nr:hypothetical protein [Oleiagrimonas sp. C23AA]NII10135.1 hypothetical protein [Oleiagrimonas sp. C23AA]